MLGHYKKIFSAVHQKVAAHFKNAKVDESHNMKHIDIVVAHDENAHAYEGYKYGMHVYFLTQMACLLHDVDDFKYFNNSSYKNARLIMGDHVASNDITKAPVRFYSTKEILSD